MRKQFFSWVIAIFICAMALAFGNSERVSAACSHTPQSTVKTPATCGSTGASEIKCTKCGTVIRTETIPALGHSWDSGTVTTAATCTKKE